VPVLKPIRGIRLNKSHPLARGLVGYWLLNEGSGNKVFDLSGDGNAGTLVADTHFVPGKFGPALDFDGTGDYIDCGTSDIFNLTTSFTLSIWMSRANTTGDHGLFHRYAGADNYEGYGLGIRVQSGDNANLIRFFTGDEWLYSTITITDSYWHHIVAVWDGTKTYIYIDGVLRGSATPASTELNNPGDTLFIGSFGGTSNFFSGKLDLPVIYNRALSAFEIALLYREPFCMFDRAWRPSKMGVQIVELAGTIAGTSGLLDAVLSSIRGLTGTSTALSSVKGSLGIMGESPPEMERSWLREALFNGMTASAFKLGTSLSLGWFWVRVTGCSVLYRGAGMGEIDFANILTVSNRATSDEGRETISPPSYIPHNSGSTYFYVVRRFNKCGYQEHTLAAAVKVSISSSGELTEPQPNNISSSKIEQVDSNKIRLTWFYCPLEQGSMPIKFNVYYDDRTGQIDYENPLAIIEYKGRRFYSFQSPDLSEETGEEADEHLFDIRAEDASGIESRCARVARLKIQLDTLSPDAIDILRAEAV